MDTPFVMEQSFNSPVEKVWHALTDPDSMRAWYFPQLKRFEPVVGFRFEFVDDGSAYQKEWQVTQVVEGKKLAHSWTYQGYPGHSEVSFELFEEGAGTRLKLTHSGLESFPDDPHFARQRFEAGWQSLIAGTLKHQLENADGA